MNLNFGLRKKSKREKTKGQAPGSLIFVGEQKLDKTIIERIQYDEEHFSEKKYESVDELLADDIDKSTGWINVVGLHDVELIKRLGEHFKINPLVLEDILDTEQRPKYEEIDGHIFTVLKMLQKEPESEQVKIEQLSFVLGKDFLISFQEEPGDVFNPVRGRLRTPTTKIRTRNLGYLMFALEDTVVDNYIFIVESIGARIEDLEERVLIDTSQETLAQIKNFKRDINQLRKSIRPARECILLFDKTDSPYIDKYTEPFIDDLVDHVNIATEAVETYREMLSDQLHMYHSSVSHRLNEVIRVLTIFSVIFIPLTFLAGIYGTNFKHFPELDYKYSYPIFWLVLVSIGTAMIVYFKRKGWL